MPSTATRSARGTKQCSPRTTGRARSSRHFCRHPGSRSSGLRTPLPPRFGTRPGPAPRAPPFSTST
jgi:hypothetical protein